MTSHAVILQKLKIKYLDQSEVRTDILNYLFALKNTTLLQDPRGIFIAGFVTWDSGSEEVENVISLRHVDGRTDRHVPHTFRSEKLN